MYEVEGANASNMTREFKHLENKIENLLKIKLSFLMNQEASGPSSAQAKVVSSTCLLCDSSTHETPDCHLSSSSIPRIH